MSWAGFQLFDCFSVRRAVVNFIMRVFLIHIRDPQVFALPAATRANNGNNSERARIWL